MKHFIIILLGVVFSHFCFAQQNFYDVSPGNGNGIRLWASDTYKIHMGSAPEYRYGPVTDYSIKVNMSGGTPDRGWTWGVSGSTPVAAINTLGEMQIAGSFKIVNNNEIEFGAGIAKEVNAGKITYQRFSDALDIVGAGTTSANRKLKFWNEGGAIFTGNVGIGTSSPNQKLTVSGTIYGKELKLDLNVPAPDYVFEKEYALPSLASLQTYITQNKHLPEVPSAKEMEINGINLSEMNMLLLKKVEELTLYMIELKKENDIQSSNSIRLQQQIDELKKKVN